MISKSNVLHGDSLDQLKNIESESIHLILSDIPYGIGAEEWDVLHENSNSAYLGSSPAQKKAGEIFKKRGKPINGWSEADRLIPKQYYDWCCTWAPDWLRVLKPGASVFIFAGRRYSHRCISAMEDSGFCYKDMIGWNKNKAAHRAQRVSIVFENRGNHEEAERWNGWKLGNLRPMFEPILWFTKPYKIGTTIADNIIKHSVGGYNEDAYMAINGRPDNVVSIGFSPGESGYHPNKKPIILMKLLIELSTKVGQTVLDPFCGSGSTLVAAKVTGRNSIGIDSNLEYIKISKKRLDSTVFQEEIFKSNVG